MKKQSVLDNMKVVICAVFMIVAVLVVIRPNCAKAAEPTLSDDKVTIYMGKNANVELENASNDVKWKSEDANIAIVDEDGIITPVSVGKTRISATYKNIDYFCEVTVKQPHLTQTEIQVFPFEYFELGISGTKIKKWEIADESILMVQYSYPTYFRLRALAEGETTFTIIGKDKQRYECRVIVKPCTYKASYYDKKHTKVKKISYYVDGRLEQYDVYHKGSGIKYSFKYVYESNCYYEYKYESRGLVLKTTYDYNDKVIGETTYASNMIMSKEGREFKTEMLSNWYYVFEKDRYIRHEETSDRPLSKMVYDYNDKLIGEIIYDYDATFENADDHILTNKFFDVDGNWHEVSSNIEKVYNPEGKLVNKIEYRYYKGIKTISSEHIYYQEDGSIAFQRYYNTDGSVKSEYYFNHNPYYKTKHVLYSSNGVKEEYYFDLSGKEIRVILYDQDNNIVSDYYY